MPEIMNNSLFCFQTALSRPKTGRQSLKGVSCMRLASRLPFALAGLFREFRHGITANTDGRKHSTVGISHGQDAQGYFLRVLRYATTPSAFPATDFTGFIFPMPFTMASFNWASDMF